MPWEYFYSTLFIHSHARAEHTYTHTRAQTPARLMFLNWKVIEADVHSLCLSVSPLLSRGNSVPFAHQTFSLILFSFRAIKLRLNSYMYANNSSPVIYCIVSASTSLRINFVFFFLVHFTYSRAHISQFVCLLRQQRFHKNKFMSFPQNELNILTLEHMRWHFFATIFLQPILGITFLIRWNSLDLIAVDKHIYTHHTQLCIPGR